MGTEWHPPISLAWTPSLSHPLLVSTSLRLPCGGWAGTARGRGWAGHAPRPRLRPVSLDSSPLCAFVWVSGNRMASQVRPRRPGAQGGGPSGSVTASSGWSGHKGSMWSLAVGVCARPSPCQPWVARLPVCICHAAVVLG